VWQKITEVSRQECQCVAELEHAWTHLPQLQGCQMVCFQTKNPNLGKFWRVLGRLENVNIFYGLLEYFMEIWDIL
jgi:hypothetical protein